MTLLSKPKTNFNNHGFHSDTSFITKYGIYKFSDFKNGDKIQIKGRNNNWLDTTIFLFNKQKLFEITIELNNIKRKIKTTKNNEWYLFNINKIMIKQTHELQFGDLLVTNKFNKNLKIDDNGFNHGILFFLHHFQSLPSFDHSLNYLYSFISGIFYNTGCIENNIIKLYYNNIHTLIWIKNIFSLINIITSEILFDNNQYYIIILNYYLSENFFKSFEHKQLFYQIDKSIVPLWKVLSVTELNINDYVWCFYEPIYNELILEGNILTKNCLI